MYTISNVPTCNFTSAEQFISDISYHILLSILCKYHLYTLPESTDYVQDHILHILPGSDIYFLSSSDLPVTPLRSIPVAHARLSELVYYAALGIDYLENIFPALIRA